MARQKKSFLLFISISILTPYLANGLLRFSSFRPAHLQIIIILTNMFLTLWAWVFIKKSGQPVARFGLHFKNIEYQIIGGLVFAAAANFLGSFKIFSPILSVGIFVNLLFVALPASYRRPYFPCCICPPDIICTPCWLYSCWRSYGTISD